MFSKPIVVRPSRDNNTRSNDDDDDEYYVHREGIPEFPHKKLTIKNPRPLRYSNKKVNMDGKIEVIVAYVGHALTGKTTLLSVLSKNILDDGLGSCRLSVFRHQHERDSGITSSISNTTIGFIGERDVPNDRKAPISSMNMCINSTKLVTLVDLPGTPRFLNTTLYGITSYSPDSIAVTINSVEGVVDFTRRMFTILVALKRPFHVVITKCDAPSSPAIDLGHDLDSLYPILASTRYMMVANENNLEGMLNNPMTFVPIFYVSCVKGTGLNFYKRYLSKLPNFVSSAKRKILEKQQCEFRINHVIIQTPTHSLLGGILSSGVMEIGMKFIIGPFADGKYYATEIRSIHRHRVPCTNARPLQCATIAISPLPEPVRKGLVLLNPDCNLKFTCYFETSCNFISRMRTLKHRAHFTLFIGNVKVTGYIVKSTDENEINDTDKAIIKLAAGSKQPEHIVLGSPIIYVNGKYTANGIVKHVSLNSFECS